VTARRQVLQAGAAGLLSVLVRPAAATPDTLQAALRAFTGGARVQTAPGRVGIDIASLVENGNAVPVTLTVTSPMTPGDHVQRIALFNERNPQPDVAVFHLGPRSGRAVVSTRMRLATSQQVLAVAQMSDGSFWLQAVDVVVTLAACIE
jgi:sulfur-oxidizing protein SoxY